MFVRVVRFVFGYVCSLILRLAGIWFVLGLRFLRVLFGLVVYDGCV